MHFDQHNGPQLCLIVALCVCCMTGSVYTYYGDEPAATDENSDTGENVYDINTFLERYGIDNDHLERYKRLRQLKRQRDALHGLENEFHELRMARDNTEGTKDQIPIKDVASSVGTSTSGDKYIGNSDLVKRVSDDDNTEIKANNPMNVYVNDKKTNHKYKTEFQKHNVNDLISVNNENKTIAPSSAHGSNGNRHKTISNKELIDLITSKSAQHSKQNSEQNQSDSGVLDSPWQTFQEAMAKHNAIANSGKLHKATVAKTNEKTSDRNDGEDKSDYSDDDDYENDEDEDKTDNPALKNISVKKLDMVIPFDRRTEGDFKDHVMWMGIGTAVCTILTILSYLIYRFVIYIRKWRGDFVKDISLGSFTDHKLDQNPMYVRLSQVHNQKTGNHYVVSILDDKKEENGWSSEEEEVFNISAIKDQKNSTPIKSMTSTPIRHMTSKPNGTPKRGLNLP